MIAFERLVLRALLALLLERCKFALQVEGDLQAALDEDAKNDLEVS